VKLNLMGLPCRLADAWLNWTLDDAKPIQENDRRLRMQSCWVRHANFLLEHREDKLTKHEIG